MATRKRAKGPETILKTLEKQREAHKQRELIQVLRKDKQYLLHMLHPSCFF
jgi:hypothetical protein